MPILSRLKFEIFNSFPAHISIIFLGIFLRVQQYFFNRSLWLDEAALASSIIEKNYSALLKPLIGGQLAPFGYLWASKFFANLIGSHEYGLRFFSLICGVGSLIAFSFICKVVLDRRAIVFALLLFALHGQSIYFASEAKPYSCDVFFTLGIIFLTIRLMQLQHTFLYGTLLVMCGALGIWFSFPLILVLVASLGTLGYFALVDSKKVLPWLIIGGVAWAISYLTLNYFLQQNFDQGLKDLYSHYWREYFVSLIPHNAWQLQGLIDHLMGAFKDPGGFYFRSLALLLFFVGGNVLWGKNKFHAALLFLPIALTLLASFLKKYPFAERLILFLTPIVIIFVSCGLIAIIDQSIKLPILKIALIAMILFHPILSSAYHVLKPRTREEVDVVLKYINNNWQEGDVLYIQHFGVDQFNFYKNKMGVEFKNTIVGAHNQSSAEVTADLDQLKGKGRVWFLFPHMRYQGEDGAVDRAFFEHLEVLGKRYKNWSFQGLDICFLKVEQ